jgi:hypothetical protein
MVSGGGGPFVLYGMTGFAGLLAAQGFEKNVTRLTGATAAGAAVVVFFGALEAGDISAGERKEPGPASQVTAGDVVRGVGLWFGERGPVDEEMLHRARFVDDGAQVRCGFRLEARAKVIYGRGAREDGSVFAFGRFPAACG